MGLTQKIILTIVVVGICTQMYSQSNIGVNTDSPQLPLDVRGLTEEFGAAIQAATPNQTHFLRLFSGNSGSPNPALLFHDSDTFHIVTTLPDLSTYSRRLSVLPNGSVGINDEAPTAQLEVKGEMDTAIIGRSYETDGVGVYGFIQSTNGRGVHGYSSANSGTNYGVYGKSNSPNGYGVYGESTGYGLYGEGFFGAKGSTDASSGIGVIGESIATTGTTYGVYGFTQSTSGRGVYGFSLKSTGVNYGVYGKANSPNGYGVYGESTGYGLYGEGFFGAKGSTDASSGIGVIGESIATSGNTYGVYGFTQSTSGRGVYGYSLASSGTNFGVYGKAQSSGGRGVFGEATSTSGSAYGVYGHSSSLSGRGVYGSCPGQEGYGLYGLSTGEYGKGLYAEVTSSHSSANAILARSGGGSSYAAYLIGRVHITGQLRVIDVPMGDYANMQYNTATGQLFYDNSSRRYKENIRTLDADFSKILQARPVQYTRPGNPNRKEIGYIAEEMEELGLDELIGHDAQGEVENFNYEKMIIYVVEVVKEQQREIERLSKEIETLREKRK